MIDLSEIDLTYIAASKYMCSNLIEDLTDRILLNGIDSSNALETCELFYKLNINSPAINRFYQKLAADLAAVCSNDGFKKIEQDTLIFILNFESLNIAEFDLLKACLRWTDNKVKRLNQGEERTKKGAEYSK